MDEILAEDAIALYPLRLWKGIVLDWGEAMVEDGSCVEMRETVLQLSYSSCCVE